MDAFREKCFWLNELYHYVSRTRSIGYFMLKWNFHDSPLPQQKVKLVADDCLSLLADENDRAALKLSVRDIMIGMLMSKHNSTTFN